MRRAIVVVGVLAGALAAAAVPARALGVASFEIDVRRRDVERSAAGKLALVIADRPALTTA
jgi:hypothetical protein